MEFLKERLGTEFVEKHRLGNLILKGASRGERGMLQSEQHLQSVLQQLENELLPASVDELNGKNAPLCHVSVLVESTLPVCLAGLAGISMDDHGREGNVQMILNVIPSPVKTLILVSTLARHESYLHYYMRHMLDGMNGVLIAIETWMVRGTDHWFITPSEWERIPEARRARILNDMFDDSVGIGHKYPYSVIDSVRERMLALPEAKEMPVDIYRAEATKLTDIL
jgi:hypothetical protein